MSKKEKKYKITISVQFTDDEQNYSHDVLLESNDIFLLEAYRIHLKKAFEYLNPKKIDAESLVLRRNANEHTHPNWPCAYDEKKKNWSCGEPSVVNRNTVRIDA